MTYRYALPAAALLCVACTVEVTDRTVSPFTYDPPINAQTLRVEVQSTSTVKGVEFDAPGAGTGPMSLVADNTYEAVTPVPTCAGAVDFTVDVTYQAFLGDDTDTFPEVGRFTHQVSGLPPECEDFIDNFAQTFVVDETADFPDINPGDGECLGFFPGPSSGCSLRAAVMEANAKPGADLIRVPSGRYTLTRFAPEDALGISQSVRDLDITESVTIEGISGENTDLDNILSRSNDFDEDLTDNGNSFGFFRIDGNEAHRIFHVTASDVVLRLRRVALLNGDQEGQGGAILNEGTLVLEKVAIAENRATSVTGGAFGGGAVQNNGTMIGEEVAFAQNIVTGMNPAGGAIHNTGSVTLRRALLAYNDARFGAAIRNIGGSLIMENVTVFKNEYSGISGPSSTVNVVGNQDNATARLNFVTFSNHGIDDRDLLASSGGADVRVKNSLWVDNFADLCSGTIVSEGGNVVEGNCGFAASSSPLAPDHENVGIVTGAELLTDAGGFLPVVEIDAPFAGSSLFDARERGFSPPFPFTDQRSEGFARRIDADGEDGAQADAGAYEWSP